MSGNAPVRNRSYEHMRILACLAIVLMHMVNISEILYRKKLSVLEDGISMLVVYLCMWAVPVFVMVTGALLLDPSKEIPIKKVYTRYIARVLAALVIFAFVFRFFDMFMNGEEFSSYIITNALYKIYTGTSWSHLWYLYTLIGLYLLLPVYRKVAASCEDKEIKYLIAIFFIFISLFPISEAFGLKSAFRLQTTAVYLLYFFAGYAIKSGIIRINKLLAFLLMILSIAGICVLCYMRYVFGVQELSSILGSYASPFVINYSIAVFALLYSDKEKKRNFFRDIISYIDSTTFGIYLIHLIFLRLFLRYMEMNPYADNLVTFAKVYGMTLGISFVIAAVLHALPGFRKIV